MNVLIALSYLFFLYIKYNFIHKGKKRYFSIYKHIFLNKPINICEIGVFTGERSREIITLSGLLNKKKTIYSGFDLFEEITDEQIKLEFSKKPLSFEEISVLIKKNKFCSDFKLIRGNTIKTLKDYKFQEKQDLIFIDGGHSIQTISSDFYNLINSLKSDGSIIFDDYYLYNSRIIKEAGCNFLIDKIKNDYDIKTFGKVDIHQNFKFGKIGIKLALLQKLR